MTLVPNFDITSANAVLVLAVESIFPSGIVLEQFGTDQALNPEAQDITETRMGVDGKMVAGYVPMIHALTVTLEASSPSRYALYTLWEAMATNRTIYACSLVATLPAVGEVITWKKGVLKNGQSVPVQKTLGPTNWVFNFEQRERARI